MLNDIKKASCKAIISIFETGKLNKNYGMVTLMRGDTGGLTYGKHQVTLNSGNLYLLIKAYCEDTGADYKNQFVPYLDRLNAKDSSLDTDEDFKALLRKAGDDADMKEVQDAFFDRVFWNPAAATAQAMEFKRPLSYAVVYDSYIHGAWKLVRDRVNAKLGATSFYNEVGWIREYNKQRRDWLGNHSNTLLRKTVYRQETFDLLMRTDNWELSLPMNIRGVTISTQALGFDSGPTPGKTESAMPDRATAQEEAPRLIMLTDPLMSGEDIRQIQVALDKFGYPVTTDGMYGPVTAEAVRLFQRQKGLRSDGIVGQVTRFNLGLE